MVRFIFKQESKITLIAFILIIAGLMLRFFSYTGAGNTALIAATLIAMLPIGIKAYQALIMKVFSIELLVSIAVIERYYRRVYRIISSSSSVRVIRGENA